MRALSQITVALCATLAVVSGCAHLPARPGMATEGGWQAVTFSSPTQTRPVILHYGDAAKLTKLASIGLDIWSVDRHAHKAKCSITSLQSDVAKTLGMTVEVMRAQDASLTVDKGYRSYDQVLARMQELAKQSPDFVQLVDIGDSWEKTVKKSNHDLWALKIGKGSGKPIVTFVGCTHAREIVTPEMVLMQAEKLVTQYGKDAAVTAAVDSREIWLVPMVNPDGHAHAMKGESWRKNANTKDGGKDLPGIDLNRNYGSFWGMVGDSSDPDSEVFRGPKAFSEPETQAIAAFTTAHVPSIFMTFHSFSNSVMWPWDHANSPPPDARLAKVGAAMGKLSGYEAYQGCDMYLNGGDDEEWVFENLKSLAFTIEIGTWSDGFMPPFAKVPQFFKENSPMMDYALKIADNPSQTDGPATHLAVGRNALSISAPGAARVESFLGTAGTPGTGRPVALVDGKAQLTPVAGPRRVLYVHAQDAHGTWGPWETAWSN
jgi:carboxypeptidase T